MLHITMVMDVRDAALYAAYREAMTPILHSFGGAFSLDIWVQEVLRAPKLAHFNRLFTISFPSEVQLDAFFADERYVAIRERLFVPAVGDYEQVARYEL